jgi:hypothetical protein
MCIIPAALTRSVPEFSEEEPEASSSHENPSFPEEEKNRLEEERLAGLDALVRSPAFDVFPPSMLKP